MTLILGSIENQWPGVQEMPDWGKVSFPSSQGRSLSELLPGASDGALELLGAMIKYCPEDRIKVEDALSSAFFLTEPFPYSPSQIKMSIVNKQ